MERFNRLFRALLACAVCAAPAAHAAGEFAVGAAVAVAADGPVSVTVLANHTVAFPDDYVVNALFQVAPSPTAPALHVVSTVNRANRAGEANRLPGMPGDAGQPGYRPLARGTPLVFQLVTYFPRAVPRFASLSTADPSGLAGFVNAGFSRANVPQAAVRSRGGATVEIAFPGPYGVPDSFDEYPLRIRVSNARVE